jgi:archaellum biogenesis ATPase FlaH
MSRADILAAAQSYATRGWRVFPLNGKVPFAGTKGFLDGTIDPKEIEAFWHQYPSANVGIVTGSKSGIFVVDIDGDAGAQSWKDYETAYGKERTTLESQTRRGRHLYFAQPIGIPVRNQASGELGTGVDVRGDGGYVVAPPSIHPEDVEGKNPYRWVDSKQICVLPSEQLISRVRADRSNRKNKANGHELPLVIPKGERDDALYRHGCQLRWMGYSTEEIYHALVAVNNARCKPPMEDSVVVAKAQQAGKNPPGKCSATGATTDFDIIRLEAATMVARPVTWRWPSFIPRGVIVIWAGDPGHGKTVMSCYLAAKVSRGEKLPGDNTPETYKPEHVLMISAEDDYDTTILPRLQLAQADLNQVTFIDARLTDGRQFLMPEHLTNLTRAIEEKNTKLIIIDPLDAFIGDGIDSYKNSDVRRMLSPMKSIAERTKATFLIIMHLNKSKESSALQRVGGTGAFVAAPRASFIFGADPENEEEKIFACAKINIAKKPKSLRFAVEVTYMEGIGGVPRIAWRGESSESADSIAMIPANGNHKGPRDTAKKLLKEIIGDSAVMVSEVKKQMKAAGISDATIRRASEEIDVRPKKIGKDWWWSLAGYSWQREPGDETLDPFEAENEK